MVWFKIAVYLDLEVTTIFYTLQRKYLTKVEKYVIVDT